MKIVCLLLGLVSACSLDSVPVNPRAGDQTSEDPTVDSDASVTECLPVEVRARRIDGQRACTWPYQQLEVCVPKGDDGLPAGGNDGELWGERNGECWVFGGGPLPVSWSEVNFREPGACGSVIREDLATCACEAGACDGGSGPIQ